RPSDFIVNAPTGPAAGITSNLQFLNATALTSASLFSSEGGSKISGVYTHFYGIEVSINGALLTVQQVDINGKAIRFISDIQSIITTVPGTPTNYNNGTYGFSAAFGPVDTLEFTLNNGNIFYSS
ncbi:MAG: hypothetical protein ACXAC7_19395, partial [Candidatus Hodarchaeales archaeon]